LGRFDPINDMPCQRDPKRHIPVRVRVVWALMRKNLSTRLARRSVPKKVINKNGYTIIYSYNTTIRKNLYLIVTFRSPTANFIGHVVTWRWRWARNQNTVIHRSLVGCKLPRLCSYSWPPCVCGLTPWVVLFSADFLCLRSWHRTNRTTDDVFWSRAHHQRHVTICLMKFAVGERNVAIRYIFLRMVVLFEYFIEANPTRWTFTNKNGYISPIRPDAPMWMEGSPDLAQL